MFRPRFYYASSGKACQVNQGLRELRIKNYYMVSFRYNPKKGKGSLKRSIPVHVLFYHKLSWFVSELPEKDISNTVVQCK